MSEAHTHEPKLQALHALQAQRLSEAGLARLRRHLAQCEPCSAALRGLRLHAALSADLRASTPELAFGRMELAMRQHARQAAQRSRVLRFAVPVVGALAVAAALLLLVHRPVRTPQPQATHTVVASEVATREPVPLLHAVVTALRGQASVSSAQLAAQPLGVDRVVNEGEVLALEANAELHLRLAEQTAIALQDGARVELRALRQGEIQLGLLSGSVTSQVHHLVATERYEVHALGYTVAVRGTHFLVSVANGQLRVVVEEGHVVVTDQNHQVVGDVVAPGVFESGASKLGALATKLVKPRVAGVPGTLWPALVLPAWRNVAAWQVDGSTFAASAQLAMRVPTGELTLTAQLGDGQLRKTVVTIPPEGLRVEDDVLRRLTRVADDEPRELKPEAIMGVVQQGLPVLQRCYELGLKQQPALSGRLTLRIAVDGAGRVTRVAPRGDAGGVPEDLMSCIRAGVSRWRFPPTGGSGLTFDAPIRLEHQHQH